MAAIKTFLYLIPGSGCTPCSAGMGDSSGVGSDRSGYDDVC